MSLDHDSAFQAAKNAIRANDLNTVEQFATTYPSILEERNILGSLLHMAASKGHLPIVKRLVELGSDIAYSAEVGGNPLCETASEGHADVARYLIDIGVPFEYEPGKNQLISAVNEGHVDVCRLLLERGFDAHYTFRSNSGKLNNAMSFAVKYQREEIIELLRSAGCHLPIEGQDIPAWQPAGWREVTADNANERARDDLVEYLASIYGPVDPLALQEIVPVDADVRVAVHVIPPSDDHEYLTLFTTGMSDRPLTIPEGVQAHPRVELIMFLPKDWPLPRTVEGDERWL